MAKRFYQDAAAVKVDRGYDIHLDGKAVHTPMGNALTIPTWPLAEAVAAEWQGQSETIDPNSMPLCGYANTAIDRVGPDRGSIVSTVLAFGGTDLLCYRAEHPEDLVNRQREQWQPLLDWAAVALDARLRVTAGITPIEQPVESLEALNGKLGNLDDMELAAVASLAAACGSLILALALDENRLDSGQVFQLCQLDETFQIERWGKDAEVEGRHQRLREDISSAALFLSLLRQC